ncbi:GxxExxY protein [Haoranjiania flava]|uniref:GxxExxY protein n=1 Tax=Haoranjiania flava TaxID=1856322 RepID=A0AAE3IPX1_9BACT|nr:GxxExxY protein [Haoranjiania flava]MCU7694883.1 GxxExxY protein [Haoranjiania flava]
MNENELAKVVFNTGLKIHKHLGPGLLESAYEECLYYELMKSGLNIAGQKTLPLIYEEIKLEIGYRVDFLIENKLVVEIKSVESLNDIHLAQILTYLRLSHCKLGLLINFNTLLFKDGVRRVINGTL